MASGLVGVVLVWKFTFLVVGKMLARAAFLFLV